MKKIAILFCVLTFMLTSLLTGCSSQKAAPAEGGKLKVIVSFNAMKEFVQAVGKDKVEVSTLIPEGTELHEFQPTTKDMKTLHDAKLFVYNGAGMENWVDTAVKAADNPKLITVEATKGVNLIKLTDPDEIKEHGTYDPHTWLSLTCAQIEVQNIAEALASADEKNADFYRKNAAAYKQQLQTLLDEYQQKFAKLPSENKEFVTGHAAFAYLCRDFGLKQNSVEDVFASGEPSAQNMAKLVDYCKANKVKTIFVEEAVSPKTSQTLAKEVGAKTQAIHTLESSEDGKDYLTLMQENLDAIYKSLK